MSFYVYKSSAGSGKTFTLVRAYLRIALATDNAMQFRHILAMTFTNKAAQEMSDRILLMLKEMAKPNNEGEKGALQMRTFLAHDLAVSEELITRRASHVLGAILHNYSEFAVGTIDSFVHRIIRAFASEMELSQNFELELNHKAVMQRAVNLLLDDVGVNKDLTNFLQEFAQQKVASGKSWNIKRDLFDFAYQLGNSHHAHYFDQAAEVDLGTYVTVRKKYQKEVNVLTTEIKKLAQPILKALLGVSTVPKDHASSQIFLKFITACSEGKVVEIKDTTVKIGHGGKLYSGKADKETKLAFEAISEEVTGLFTKLHTYLTEYSGEYHLKTTLIKRMHYTALIGELNKKVKQIKAENNLVLINEFTKLVGRVTQSEPVPFIYEKLGTKYTHLLFDEHQDTSLSQWQNMLALVQNSLSAGGSSLVVGDAKQSIYRWRGGEVGQFQQLPKPYNPMNAPFVEDWNSTLEQAYTYSEPLQTNYRSKANVVKFNNLLFKNFAKSKSDILLPIYNEVEQEILDPNSGGVVELTFLVANKKAEEFRDDLATELIAPIQRAFKDGYNYKDIAILTRGKKTNPLIVETLQGQGIPVVSSESLLVSNSDSVLLVSAMLNHICNPTAPFYMQQVGIYWNKLKPQLGFDSWMFGFKKMPNKTLADKQNKEQKFYAFLLASGVHLDFSKMATLPLYELISYLVIAFDLSNADNKLAAYCQYAFEFSLKPGVTVYDFMEDWIGKSEELSIQMPDDFDAVNLLTIHKSKGLDWPVVIMYNVNETLKHNSLWVELGAESEIPVGYFSAKELKAIGITDPVEKENAMVTLDYINLLYVGFTRAADRLHIFGANPQKNGFKEFLPSVDDLAIELGVEPFYEQDEKGKDILSYMKFGNFTPKKKVESAEGHTQFYTLKNERNTLYQRKLKVKKNYLSRLSASNEIDYGNIVHKGFSYVKSKNDIDGAITQLLNSGDITEKETSHIAKMMTDVVNHPQLGQFFNEGLTVRTEAEIVLSNGETIIPDRVVITDNEVAVIDFKTGLPHSKYTSQINSYKEELMALGYTNVEGYLMYTSTNQVEVV